MNTKLIALASTLLLTFMVLACGGGTPEASAPETPAATDESQAPASEPPAAEPAEEAENPAEPPAEPSDTP